MTGISVDSIVSFLEQDKIKNLNILGFIKNYGFTSIDKIGDSVILRGKSDENWVYVSVGNKNRISELVKNFTDQDRFFAAVEDDILPFLSFSKKPVWKLSALKLVLPDHVKLPESLCYEIIPLTLKDIPFIYNNSVYKELLSENYIMERIEKGLSAGIYQSGRLAAWIMTHDDSALGFLHVLDEYRQKGMGYELALYLIKETVKQGQIPFVHIEETNLKSLKLAEKIGFEKDRKIHWLELEK